jgi:hypothetical protein
MTVRSPAGRREPARQPPRHRRQVVRRRRRLVLGLAVLVGLTAYLVAVGWPGAPRPARDVGGARSGRAAGPGTAARVAVRTGLLPWRLAAAISREVAVPAGQGDLLLAGGLGSGAVSQTAIVRLSLPGGLARTVGRLAAPVHDAAGYLLGGRLTVAGGGSQVPSALVQRAAVGGRSAAGRSVGGLSVGRCTTGRPLPRPDADLTAATVAGTAYLFGGYDGSALTGQVWAGTATGFRVVGRLARPVRYPATVAVGPLVYLFGGSDLTGRPTATVQVFDVRTGRGRVVGRLPEPLAGAGAGLVGGTVYLAGGQTAGGVSRAVLAFRPARAVLRRVGTLPVGVAYAAAAVLGGRLWLVGGETAGVPQRTVQVVTAQPVRPG